MSEIKSIEQLSLILGYIVPGLIIMWIRAQFLTGRMAPHRDALLSYFTLSVVYLALQGAVTTLATGSAAPLSDQSRYWLPISLMGALCFGCLIGINAAFGWSRQILALCGISLPHVLDSAWDWKFSKFAPSLVLITLKDGSTVAGWCGENSFIGSKAKDPDIYIEQVYDIDEQNNWMARAENKGIYIAGGEIRSIEFIPLPMNGVS